jgi:hypothetical protein
MGLYFSEVFNTTTDSDYQHCKHTKQYLSEQPFYSSFTIPRVSRETSLRTLSQAGFSKQLQQCISLSANAGPQDRRAQRYVVLPVQITLP